MTISRRSVLQATAAGAATASSTLLTSGSAAATPGTFRVASYNIYTGLTTAKFRDDLDFIAARADLIGLNEVNERRSWMRNTWANRAAWHIFSPTNGDGPRPGWGAECAIIARRDRYDFLAGGSKFVCDTNGSDGPPPPRYLNWATFKDRTTGIKITVINSHANAGIDDGGRPTDLPRTRDAEKHFQMIRDLAVAKSKEIGQVVVTGDLNVDYVNDKRVKYGKFPYTVLETRQNGVPSLRSCYSLHGVQATGTHGSRHIDYVYEWVRVASARNIRMTGYTIPAKRNSDHRPVIATFNVLN